MERCLICRRPMQVEYVEMYRINLNNEPELYRNVRRFACPEGCRGVRYDFSKARPASSGVLLKVVPKVKPLKKKPDFNDRLLAIGLTLAYILMIVGIMIIPSSAGVKIGAAVALTAGLLGLYRLATQRVVLPSYFPVPLPPQTERRTSELAAAAPATAPAAPARAPAPKASAPETAAPAAQQPAPAKAAKGGGIAMKVIVGGEEHILDVAAGENMLFAALDREVSLDYSCLEGLCDSCAVKVIEGLENVSPPTKEEIDMLGDDVHQGMRLACQVKVHGPVTISQG